MVRILSIVLMNFLFGLNYIYAQALCVNCKDAYATLQTVDQSIAASNSVSDIKTKLGATIQTWNSRAERLPVCKANDPNCKTAPEDSIVNLVRYYLNVLDQTLDTLNISKSEVESQMHQFKLDTLQELQAACKSFNGNSVCS